ncbi:MAG: MFS transporter [Deltaproteobacteria bacterium]|nr:MFS transporter [Deltaproteobacteria bacterium]
MNIKSLSPEVRHIWRVAKVVQGVMGFTMGLYVFTYGPLFYEKLSHASDPKLGMTLTTLWFAIMTALITFLEVPTGAIGDVIGRKWTVVWSFVCRMCFFIFLAAISFSQSITLVLTLGIIAALFFGFSYTFFSGTFTAWCVDSLRERAPDIGYEHLLSRSYTYNFLAQILGGILGVLFYVWHIPYVGFLIGALSCMVCVAFCLGEMEEVKNIQFLEHKTVSLTVITRRIGEILGVGFQVFSKSSVILSLTLVFASYMFVVNIVDYLWPVYLRTRVPTNIQTSLWIGLVVAILLVSTLGSHTLTLWTRRWHKKNGARTHNTVLRRWFIATSLFAALPILTLSWLTARGLDTFWYFTFAILAVEYAYGVIAPCYETLVNNYIPEEHSQQRATIMSFGSLMRSLLVMLLAIPAGGTSGAKTTIGWAIPAFLLLASAIIGNFVLKRAQRKTLCATELPPQPLASPILEKE